MNARFRPRLAAMLTAVVLALALAPTASAADGEVGDVGDVDSITDLFINGAGRTTAQIDYPHDCPVGLSCNIEVMFEHKCPEWWCLWGNQGWRVLPNPNANGVSTISANCMPTGDEDNEWKLKYRIHWWAPQVKTVEIWGEWEWLIELSGAGGYRMIAEALFNVTNNAGIRIGTKLETTTATWDYGPELVVATSFGEIFHTC